MASAEVYVARLSEAERDALVVKLDAAAAQLGTDKAPKMVFLDDNGTWEIGCTLDGEPDLLERVLSSIYLGIGLP